MCVQRRPGRFFSVEAVFLGVASTVCWRRCTRACQKRPKVRETQGVVTSWGVANWAFIWKVDSLHTFNLCWPWGVAQACLRGGKGSQWWHGGGAATCMCRRGWVEGEGRCTSACNAEQAIRNAVQAGLQRWTSVCATLNKRFGTLHKRVWDAVQAYWNAAQACVQRWASDSLGRSGTFRWGNTEVVFHGILKAQYLMKC